MQTNIDSAKKDAFSETLQLFPFAFNKNLLRKMLEKNWDIYLSVYTNCCTTFLNKKTHSYFLQIPFPSNSNYLLLAKIFNLLCNSSNLKYIIRQLAKKEFNDIQLVKCLSKKFLSKSFFFRWLLRLWIEKLSEYMQCYNAYICKSPWIIDVHNIKIRYLKSYLFFEIKDLLFLRFYHIRTQMLYTYSVSTEKHEQNKHHPFVSINGKNRDISCLGDSIKFFSNKENNSNLLLFSNYLFHKKRKMKIFSQKRYRNLIKKMIQCNKTNIQVDLIKKMNQIIKLWDRSWNIILEKKDCKNLNDLLLESLWHWAIVRHSNKPERWCYARYWCSIYDGLYFSGF
jgi:hypothetical protein